MIPFGKERWRRNRAFCTPCYDRIRKGTSSEEEESHRNPEPKKKKKKRQVSIEVDPEELGL
jgi:hypothetical protein